MTHSNWRSINEWKRSIERRHWNKTLFFRQNEFINELANRMSWAESRVCWDFIFDFASKILHFVCWETYRTINCELWLIRAKNEPNVALCRQKDVKYALLLHHMTCCIPFLVAFNYNNDHKRAQSEQYVSIHRNQFDDECNLIWYSSRISTKMLLALLLLLRRPLLLLLLFISVYSLRIQYLSLLRCAYECLCYFLLRSILISVRLRSSASAITHIRI